MNVKKLLSMAVAAAMAASATATVFAADYPIKVTQTGTTTAIGAPSVGTGDSSASPAATVTANAVSNAIKNAGTGKTAVVYVTGSASIPKSVVSKITAPVTFKGVNYSMTIDPSKMTESVDIKCGVKTNSASAQATFEKYFNEPVATVSCSQKGVYGGTVTITVKPDNIGKLDTSKTIYVYSWNPTTNKFKRMGTAVVLSNGQIQCSVTRGYNLVLSNAASFTAK